MPAVSVLVINYLSADLLDQCLSALSKSTTVSYECIVVNNGSPDLELTEKVAAKHNAKLILNQENRGYACAVNQAAAHAQADILLLVNPDVVVSPGAIDSLMARLLSNPDIGVVGARLHGSTGQLSSAGGPEPAPFPLIRYKLSRVGARSGRRLTLAHGRSPLKVVSLTPRPIQWVSGALMCTSASVWQEVQGFDERFFLYFEDVDYCRRVRNMGKEVWFEPMAQATHLGGGSQRSEGALEAATCHYFDGLRYYVRKHHGLVNEFLVRNALPVYRRLGIRHYFTGRS